MIDYCRRVAKDGLSIDEADFLNDDEWMGNEAIVSGR